MFLFRDTTYSTASLVAPARKPADATPKCCFFFSIYFLVVRYFLINRRRAPWRRGGRANHGHTPALFLFLLQIWPRQKHRSNTQRNNHASRRKKSRRAEYHGVVRRKSSLRSVPTTATKQSLILLYNNNAPIIERRLFRIKALCAIKCTMASIVPS